MIKTDIANAQTSSYDTAVGSITPDSMSTDGPTGQDETEWINTNWSKQWGYFNDCPELKSALLMKAKWITGKGYTADARTMAILDHISGSGKDTFSKILNNMCIISRVGGDAYAEIIRDEETDILLNLKPLDPGTIKIIVDSKGRIKRYEQISKIDGETVHKFEPRNIFHLSHNRLADQIHGISDLESLYSTLEAEKENFEDIKKVMHFQVRPFVIWKMKTDNVAKINAFKGKVSDCRKNSDDLFVPDDEDLLSWEVIQIVPSASIFSWRQEIKNKFYRAIGMPEVIFGTSGATESGGKMEYLSHETVFESDQAEVQNEIWSQLFLKIDLIPPTSLLENMQTDQAKDGAAQMMNMQQNDVTAGSGS